MTLTTKLLAAIFVMAIATPALAQNPQYGDYYQPGPTMPQQASPRQQREFRHGDYYDFSGTRPQKLFPAQAQEQRQGDYYKPGTK